MHPLMHPPAVKCMGPTDPVPAHVAPPFVEAATAAMPEPCLQAAAFVVETGLVVEECIGGAQGAAAASARPSHQSHTVSIVVLLGSWVIDGDAKMALSAVGGHWHMCRRVTRQ